MDDSNFISFCDFRPSSQISRESKQVPHLVPIARRPIEPGSLPKPVDTEAERIRSLEDQLSLKNQQLDAVSEQLKQGNLAFQQFANAVSHDLQAPLRAINGFSHFLQQEYEEQLDETAKGYIRHVVDGANRLGQQIRGLVAFSRVSSREASMETVDLNAVMVNALNSLQDLIVDSDAVVEYVPLPVVYGDRDQLTLLLVNLIGNGLKFNESENPRVHVSANQVEDHWQVEVKDNGIGIPVEHREVVFEMFRQLNGEKRFSGIGAGLAVCHRIVQRHAGTIWYSGNADSGSTACFSIPIQ